MPEAGPVAFAPVIFDNRPRTSRARPGVFGGGTGAVEGTGELGLDAGEDVLPVPPTPIPVPPVPVGGVPMPGRP